MRKRWSCSLILLATATAWAHDGPRFWIANLCGDIATYTSDNDFDPSVYRPARLFATQLEPLFGVYTTQFPGFEVRRAGGNVAPGTTFGFNIAGPALYFDDVQQRFVTVEQMFGGLVPIPVPQLAVSQGQNLRVTSTGPVAGFPFFTFHQVGDHSHLSFTLLGDGKNPVDGPSGVYVLSLELTSGSLQTSPIFHLLVRKGVEETDPLYVAALDVARSSLALPGDLDFDGDADLYDVAALQRCFTGPGAFPLPCECALSDLDGDSDIDFDDATVVLAGLKGPQ